MESSESIDRKMQYLRAGREKRLGNRLQFRDESIENVAMKDRRIGIRVTRGPKER